jgi:hypothetical protein
MQRYITTTLNDANDELVAILTYLEYRDKEPRGKLDRSGLGRSMFI